MIHKAEKENNDVERFINPSNQDYIQALKEIKNGKKETHWIWYIFPIMKGLRNSNISKFYGIKDLQEAKYFLNHEILGKRLIEITQVLLDLQTDNLVEIFGDIDAKKIQSCMTLFYLASDKKMKLFINVLNKYCNGNFCDKTIELLKLKESFK